MYYILYQYLYRHIYMYLYTLILKGFIPKTHHPFQKKVLNFNKLLIKYISIEKLLVLNKNKVLKYWKTCLHVCTDSNSSSSQILFCISILLMFIIGKSKISYLPFQLRINLNILKT